ncbi:MAG TPA: PAS domain S-box protein [Dehalococcoidia bacterium]|nr:PAS domain S-box protein [Dehalococcoidia bacterium]
MPKENYKARENPDTPQIPDLRNNLTEQKKADSVPMPQIEEDYSALVRNLTDAVFKLKGGIITWCNDRAEQICGYSKQEMLGKKASFFYPINVSPAEFTRDVSATMKAQGHCLGTTEFAKKNGGIVNIEYLVSQIPDQEPVEVIVVARDVTERKQAEETLRKAHQELEIRVAKRTAELAKVNEDLRLQIAERERVEKALRESESEMRLMFESVSDGIMVTDLQGRIVKVNEALARLHGYESKEELIGKSGFELVAEKDHKLARKSLKRTLEDGHVTNMEYTLLTKDGREFDAELSATVLADAAGAVTGFIAITRDITERKRSEEKLQELYKQEKDLRQQLETEMKRRVEFTRELAHELKTPLTSVLASSELLLAKLRDERSLALAKNINRSALNLDSRVDELLDLARGEVGMLELKLEATDLLQLIRDVADTITPVTAGHGQSLVLDLPPVLPLVRADPDRIRQILYNLLGNAVKFTPKDGKITLRVKQRQEIVTVEVQDTGRGMSKEEQERLFERYYRPQGDRLGMGGLGLGLALCKTLVGLHGGEIWVRSFVGRGSTFGFSLPVEPDRQKTVVIESTKKLWKVLIIEDDQQIVDFISLAFQMDWPEAELISTRLGEEGIALVETAAPDIVILDLGLPDIDGFEALKEIRAFSSVPVVILTVRAEENDIIKGLGLGADDYIAKPFRQMELLARLKVQLRKQGLPDEDAPIVCGPLRFDPSTSQFTHGRKEISLSLIEGHIIGHLMRNIGRVVPHSRLAEALWGEDYAGSIETLRVYIRRLREKVEEDASNPRLILTKPGIGYLMSKPT